MTDRLLQGWRLEIQRYPLLTIKGAWRRQGDDDASSYGGFYSQDQVKDVVAHAASRGIEVVPEIEMPGHCCAALACFPHLSCTQHQLIAARALAPFLHVDIVRYPFAQSICIMQGAYILKPST